MTTSSAAAKLGTLHRCRINAITRLRRDERPLGVVNIGEAAALEHSAELCGAPSSLAGALVDFVIYQPLDIERIQRETCAPFTKSAIVSHVLSTYRHH